MVYKKMVAVAVLGFALVGCGGVTANNNDENPQEPSTSNPYPAPVLSDDVKQAYLDTINQARAQEQDCGANGVKPAVPALAWSDTLYTAAYEHSNDLAESNTASHDGSGTDSDWTGMDLGGKQSTFAERIENNGYTWRSVGENIAMGTYRDTAQKAIDAWLASDGHCANLMSTNYTEVGMAHVYKSGTTYKNYWTQNFGKPQ